LAATPVIRQDAVRNNRSRARDALADHSVLTPWRANVNHGCVQRAPRFICYMGWLRTSGKQTLQLKLMYSIGNPSKHTDEVM
jgi:hypothetical protein